MVHFIGAELDEEQWYMDAETTISLFRYCPLCRRELMPNLMYHKSGALFCPKHGDFFVQKLRGEEPLIVFRKFESGIPPVAKPQEEIVVPIEKKHDGTPPCPIRCNQTGKIYASIKAASQDMGIPQSTISMQLNKPNRVPKGPYTFSKMNP